MKKLTLIVLFVLAACRTNAPLESAKTETKNEQKRSNLTQAEAAERSSNLANVSYALNLKLDPAKDEFDGVVAINFEMKNATTNLFLDFRSGATVEKLTINGHESKDAAVVGGRIALNGAALLTGKNKVEMSYRQKYSKDGSGLYRFKDPEDGLFYHYTQFEAFDANHMLPCFDQPDLKSRFELVVTAPTEWTVISTTREKSVSEKDQWKTWTFPRTPPISPYLFSVHAGPYFEWKSRAGAIPLRLFARQSIKKYVNPEAWFVPTRKGLPFYGEFFKFPYPFKKYDQIIVPDFNAGAMENVAAVTFSERYIHRGTATDEQKESLTNTILHEMAHMWFGDLVTMKWWDGLWLNESFATNMAFFASAEALGEKIQWRSFATRSKSSAMAEDQLVTTHPVNTTIPDVRSAFTNFDGITYGKGASVLKQLRYYLGPDAFRDGLRRYFRDNAYKNTELVDFISALEKSSNKDLSKWSNVWLEQKGVDGVSADFECEAGKITRFDVRLSPPEGESTIRPHRALIQLYTRSTKETLIPEKAIAVTEESAVTEVPSLKGRACPAAVQLNSEDHDYVKVILDPRTLETLKTEFEDIQDPFARALFWRDLFGMVRHAQYPATDAIKMTENALANEKDLRIVSQVLSQEFVLHYLPRSTPEEKSRYETALARIESTLWKRTAGAMPGSEEQRIALDGFVQYARTTQGSERLIRLLDGSETVRGFTIDQDRRWAMIIRLNALGAPKAAELLAAEKKKDSSERGTQSAMTAEAARPAAAVKKSVIDRAIKDQTLTRARLQASFREIFPVWQNDLRADFGDTFYRDLPELIATREPDFLDQYVDLAPTVCRDKNWSEMQEFLQKNETIFPPEVLKSLRGEHQKDSRCLAARALARTASSKSH